MMSQLSLPDVEAQNSEDSACSTGLEAVEDLTVVVEGAVED